MRLNMIGALVIALCVAGCQTQPPPAPAPIPLPEPAPPQVEQETPPTPSPAPIPKKRTPEQVNMLQEFAIKESPKIWQTIQSMRAEMTTSEEKIRQLRDDLLEFDRNPESDEDYRVLVDGLNELHHAYDAIFDRLEDAYIAAKKFEVSPARKDYHDMMRTALEDGMQDAIIATERYKAMTRQK